VYVRRPLRRLRYCDVCTYRYMHIMCWRNENPWSKLRNNPRHASKLWDENNQGHRRYKEIIRASCISIYCTVYTL